MEIRKVYLCINYDEITKRDVILDLLEEDYGNGYKFLFGNDLKNVNECTEFWTFGNVEHIEAYKKALDLGKDIWKMR